MNSLNIIDFFLTQTKFKQYVVLSSLIDRLRGGNKFINPILEMETVWKGIFSLHTISSLCGGRFWHLTSASPSVIEDMTRQILNTFIIEQAHQLYPGITNILLLLLLLSILQLFPIHRVLAH